MCYATARSTGCFRGKYPLRGIEVRRVKDLGIDGAVAPLPVGESVEAEMDGDANFQVLPFGLLGSGFDLREVSGNGLSQSKKGKRECGEHSFPNRHDGFTVGSWGWSGPGNLKASR